MKSVSPLFVKRVKHLFTAVLLVFCPNSCRICLCETRETLCLSQHLVALHALLTAMRKAKLSMRISIASTFDLPVLRRRETSRGESKKVSSGITFPKTSLRHIQDAKNDSFSNVPMINDKKPCNN